VVCATSVPNDKRRLLLLRSICLDHRTDVGHFEPSRFEAVAAELASIADAGEAMRASAVRPPRLGDGCSPETGRRSRAKKRIRTMEAFATPTGSSSDMNNMTRG
jgi:hypothetical protein